MLGLIVLLENKSSSKTCRLHQVFLKDLAQLEKMWQKAVNKVSITAGDRIC